MNRIDESYELLQEILDDSEKYRSPLQREDQLAIMQFQATAEIAVQLKALNEKLGSTVEQSSHPAVRIKMSSGDLNRLQWPSISLSPLGESKVIQMISLVVQMMRREVGEEEGKERKNWFNW